MAIQEWIIDSFPMGPQKIDIVKLYEQLPPTKAQLVSKDNIPAYNNILYNKIYKNSLLPLKFRKELKHFLRKTGIDETWLRSFNDYWATIGGRPLWHSSDFFFLRTFFRIRQRPAMPNTVNNVIDHLRSWQDPEYLFNLFQQVMKESFIGDFDILQFLNNKGFCNQNILEYGAGSAPCISSIFEYNCNNPESKYYFCDIQTLSFHYACYKFRYCSNVNPIILLPKDNFQLTIDTQFDIIICKDVFEHLNAPMDTIKIFHRLLARNGLLIFTYIKSEARGLDSFEGLNNREEVIDYIVNNFTLLFGTIDKQNHIGLTVVQKIE